VVRCGLDGGGRGGKLSRCSYGQGKRGKKKRDTYGRRFKKKTKGNNGGLQSWEKLSEKIIAGG